MHVNGYLMLFIVLPNGYESCTNTHMSVYVLLMKGKYDSILNWPFRGVILIILDDAGVLKLSGTLIFQIAVMLYLEC